MADLIRADPANLTSYSSTAAAAAAMVDGPLATYRGAWSAFLSAPMWPDLVRPTSKEAAIGHLVDEVDLLDRGPAALAEALLLLDADGNGILSTDDCTSSEFVALFVQERQKDPFASVDAIRARALLTQQTGAELITILDPGEGRPRVLSLNLAALGPLEGLSQEQLQEVLTAYGITGENGAPVHFVVHGWTGDADSSALATGDLYAQQGVDDATVVAVNWDAGNGGDSPPGWLLPVSPIGWLAGAGADKADDFEDAEGEAQVVGNAMANVFTALAAANPDANVAVTAHSLGNHVALRALSQMEDPVDPVTGQPIRFSVDYTGIEPAIPSLAPFLDPDHYGALLTDRIDHLSMSINTSDKALLAYEARPWGDGSLGGQALGDESATSDVITTITDIREASGAGSTTIIDQNSEFGSGHLGLDPNNSEAGLVRSFYQEQIDRVSDPVLSGTSPQTAAREFIHAQFPDGMDDRIFETTAIRDYLDQCQEDGVAPSNERMMEIAMQEIENDPDLIFG